MEERLSLLCEACNDVDVIVPIMFLKLESSFDPVMRKWMFWEMKTLANYIDTYVLLIKQVIDVQHRQDKQFIVPSHVL